MKRVNPYDFYQLGSVLHPLSDIKKSSTVVDNYSSLFFGAQQIEGLLKGNLVPLRVAKQACIELKKAIEALLPKPGANPQEFATALGRQLTDYEASRVRLAAKNLETVLGAELQTSDTYLLDQKRAYSTPDLIERAEVVFSADTLAILPAVAVEDVKQAGKAIVFELPTAVGFHITRAAESVIRVYYKLVVGSDPDQRNWGYYVGQLEKTNADKRIVTTIDQVRALQRNPLMHPEVVLTEDEAITLFGMAQGLIVALAGDIIKRRAATTAAVSNGGGTPAVPLLSAGVP